MNKMCVISYALIVFTALVWPTQQLLTVPDACSVSLNPFTRAKCGSDGVTRESCLNQGCCFQDPVSCAQSTGGCYKPANCEAGDSNSRTECGWKGISRAICQCRGCCYDNSNANTVACFEPYPETKGCNWKIHDNTFILINKTDVKELKNMKLDECKAACESETEFKVMTCYYRKSDSRCYLTKVTFASAEKNGFKRTSTNFITYACPTEEPKLPVTNTCNWKKYPSKYIRTGDVIELKNKKIEECKEACETCTQFKCMAYFYKKSTSRCFLTKVTYAAADKTGIFKQNIDFDLYACPPKELPIINTCDWVRYDKTTMVLDTKDIKEITRKLSLEKCKKACETETELKCESFYYKKSIERCYLTSVTYARAQYEGLNRTNEDFILHACPTNASEIVDPECTDKKVDVMFVLDESSSISKADFKKLIDFAKHIILKLPITPPQSHVGIITFASSPEVRFTLRQGISAAKSLGMMKYIDQKGGDTNTDLALKTLINQMTTKQGGRTDAAKIGIVLTDGESGNKKATRLAAQKARDAGIKLLAIGVGKVDPIEIQDIASDPDADHVFSVSNFNQLGDLVSKIPGATCKGAPVAPDTDATPPPQKVCEIKTAYKMCSDIPPNERESIDNFYMVDPDGPDDDRICPFKVECDFSGSVPLTILHSTHENKKICSKKCDETKYGCSTQPIPYDASIFQARGMIKNAQSCSQFVRFDCKNVALDYRTHDPSGPITYWRSSEGKNMNYWPGGDEKNGGCACGKTNSCATKTEKCNCDSNDNTSRYDEGIITDMTALPVKEIAVGGVTQANKSGCFTVGPLKCF